MKNLLALSLAPMAGIDLLFLLVVFVPPLLTSKRLAALGDWPVNLGLAFIGISTLTLLATALCAWTDPVWRAGITRLQLVSFAVLGAYIFFAIVYLSQLLGGGI